MKTTPSITTTSRNNSNSSYYYYGRCCFNLVYLTMLLQVFLLLLYASDDKNNTNFDCCNYLMVVTAAASSSPSSKTVVFSSSIGKSSSSLSSSSSVSSSFVNRRRFIKKNNNTHHRNISTSSSTINGVLLPSSFFVSAMMMTEQQQRRRRRIIALPQQQQQQQQSRHARSYAQNQRSTTQNSPQTRSLLQHRTNYDHPKYFGLYSSLRGGGGDDDDANDSTSSSSMETTTTGLSTLMVPSQPPKGVPLQLVEDPGFLSLNDLVDRLNTDIKLGLSDTQVQERLTIFGTNELDKPERQSLLALIVEQFQDRLVQILLVVAFISAIFSAMEHNTGGDQSFLQSFVEPIVIISILALNAAVGVWQSQSAQDSLSALQEMQPTLCTPLRNGGTTQANLPASQLVPGDVIQLRVGDKVPADCRVIELQSSVLQVDETSLTGESVTVSKLTGIEGQADQPDAPVQSQNGMCFAGTMITAGNALAVVTSTGMATEFGKIQRGVTDAQQDTVKTPLAIKLDEFGDTLTLVIGAICFAVWLVSIPKMGGSSFANTLDGAIYYAKVAVALGVAAIPEGLPAVITLCLSLGTRRMAHRNVIVRRLPSVETLGCTSVICTDKTGTLTTNEMTVVSLVVLEQPQKNNKNDDVIVEHAVEGTSYSPVGRITSIPNPGREIAEDYPKGALADIAAVAALCSDASIVGKDDSNIQIMKNKDEVAVTIKSVERVYERIGEPTEAALCVLAEKLGGLVLSKENVQEGSTPPSVLASANVDAWRHRHPRMATLEFNRDRKSMSVLANFHPKAQSKSAIQNRLLVKGAANMVLDRCSHVKYRDGKVVHMTGNLKRLLEKKITAMSTRPLRCLALAVKDETTNLEKSLQSFDGSNPTAHPLLRDSSKYKDVESGMTFVGLVGIKDPARPEVPDSIRECTRAGIRVMMITGDARDTAIAIAKDVGIFDPSSDQSTLKAFEGREFFVKGEEEQLEILKEGNVVFCRAQPADKQKLVKMLQHLGEIPAMTGDGVNDAPALQQSAIGVAMGTGTAVAKEAADMILADDNFSTIVSAVEEGRTIYANMQAFICFLISCNIGEICAIFFATLAGFPEPLTAMHLLWVNLVTDGPPATALGFNPPSPGMMDAPPRRADEPIMTRWLLTRYVITGLYVGLATIGVFAQHYISEGVSLRDLANWSYCGQDWTPPGGVVMCTQLFRESGRMLPQTLSLTTLVCMEMLKALSAVSVNDSLFRVGPQSNKWLLLGVSAPFLLHLLVLYSSKLGLAGFGESFGVVPLSLENWKTVFLWALPILLVDELLKLIGRFLGEQENKIGTKKSINNIGI